jgi:hypothetical protein
MKHFEKKVMLSGARWRGKKKAPPPPRPWLKPPFIGEYSVATSYTVAEILDLLCEGPIEGICNNNGVITPEWFQGVFLDGTPIATTNNYTLFQPDTWKRDKPVAKTGYFVRSYKNRIPTFVDNSYLTGIEGVFPYRVTASFSPSSFQQLRSGTKAEWEWKFVYNQEASVLNFWPLAGFTITIPAGSKPNKFYCKFILHSSLTGTETREYSETFNSSGTFSRSLSLPFRRIKKSNSPQKMTIKAYSHLSLDPVWDEEGLNIDWTQTDNNVGVGQTDTYIRTPFNEYSVFNRTYDRDLGNTATKYNFNNVYMEFRNGANDGGGFTGAFNALTEDFDYDINLRGPFRAGGQVQLIE